MYPQSTTNIAECQVNGVQGYSARKQMAWKVADLYEQSKILVEYADKIRGCGDRIFVRRYERDITEIAHALFCRCRLCPMCAWRRSLKAYGQLSDAMRYLDAQRAGDGKKPWRYILVTLTVRNCDPKDLGETIDTLLESFARLRRTPEWRSAIKGCHRSLEITYNRDACTFHPHLHLLCCVQPSYFTGKAYIDKEQLIDLWQRALRVAYRPSCDIRKCEVGSSGSLNEVTKYVTKSEQWANDEIASPWLLVAMHTAIHGRKLFANYGNVREAFRALRFSDEDGDLLNVGETDSQIAREMREDLRYTLEAYTYIPYTGYMPISQEKLYAHEYITWSALCRDPQCDTEVDD